ncbi:MAG: hypothetical protein LBT54_05835, partial [Bifidobacteriaceae bacterium]|nr:hypothetical protein [Bifidobacteriaceae bacterium]
ESRPRAPAGQPQAWAGFDADLEGGAAPDPAVVARARALGVRVVETYGAAETAGGCVYDGLPLDGVAVRLGAAARIEIAGPVLALGHVLPPGSPARHPADDAAAHPADDAALAHAHPADDAAAHPADDAALAAAPVRPAPPGLATEAADGGFVTEAGRTWFRSSDLGRMGADGRLDCLGRADDVIVTGGVKVPPGPVERVVRAQAGVRDALVLGMPDPEWGEAVVALIVPEPAYPADPARVREAVRRHLGPAHAPRRVVRIGSLPTLASGKVDRAAARAFVTGAADG